MGTAERMHEAAKGLHHNPSTWMLLAVLLTTVAAGEVCEGEVGLGGPGRCCVASSRCTHASTLQTLMLATAPPLAGARSVLPVR